LHDCCQLKFHDKASFTNRFTTITKRKLEKQQRTVTSSTSPMKGEKAMSRLLFSASRTLLDVKRTDEQWTLKEKATPHTMSCLAADPEQPGRLYGGTFNDGLWISEDWGATWRKAGDRIFHNRVMSVAVSPAEKLNAASVVWAGTEPSGLFRSEDGGETWEHCPGLLDLSSKSSWSFPPRPYTHHVRCI